MVPQSSGSTPMAPFGFFVDSDGGAIRAGGVVRVGEAARRALPPSESRARRLTDSDRALWGEPNLSTAASAPASPPAALASRRRALTPPPQGLTHQCRRRRHDPVRRWVNPTLGSV